MNSKDPKIDQMIAPHEGHPFYNAHYLGYFHCFNAGLYYEAHEVLERLWLHSRGGPEALFYQALIQMAGALVHLQKSRLEPGARLFHLVLNNLASYPAIHQGLDLEKVRRFCRDYVGSLEISDYQTNPWRQEQLPQFGVV